MVKKVNISANPPKKAIVIGDGVPFTAITKELTDSNGNKKRAVKVSMG